MLTEGRKGCQIGTGFSLGLLQPDENDIYLHKARSIHSTGGFVLSRNAKHS